MMKCGILGYAGYGCTAVLLKLQAKWLVDHRIRYDQLYNQMEYSFVVNHILFHINKTVRIMPW